MDAALQASLQEMTTALKISPSSYTLGLAADDLSQRRIQTTKPATSSAQWRRHPATVLRLALVHEMGGNANKARAWLEFTHDGMQWAQRQALIYPSIARDPQLLWRAPLATSTLPVFEHGRPDSADLLDEWTRVPTEAYATLRGGMGDAGGVDQVAALYWEHGGGDPWAGLRVHLPTVVAAIAADACHI